MGKSKQTPSSSTSDSAVAVEQKANTSTDVSNSEQQEALRGEKGTDGGLAKYESTLGSWLGNELYAAVAPHLTLDSLSGYASDGFSGALEGLVGSLGGLEGDNVEIDEAALKKFGSALAEQYGPLAGKWMESDKGKELAASLGNWVDAHPGTIVTVALLAVAGAIAADMDLPTLKQKFKITDALTAGIEAKLGSIQHMALEEIKAQLAYKSGDLMAAIEVTGGKDKDPTATAKLALGDEDMKISADATFNKDGLDVYGVHGLVKTGLGDLKGDVTGGADKDPNYKISLIDKDGDTTTTTSADYDSGSGLLKIKNASDFLLDKDSNTKVGTSFEHGSDGSNKTGVDFGTNVSENTRVTGGFDHKAIDKDATNTLNAGITHKKDGFDATASGWMNDQGGAGLSGSINKDWDNGFKAGASADLGTGDKDFFKAGGYLQHIDKEGDKLRGDYNFNSEGNTHTASLFAEETLSDDWKLRSQLGYQHSDKGSKLDLSLHGAHFFNKDVAGIAGGRYELNEQGQSNFIPEFGVQVKGVPILVSHDFQTKTTSIGLTFKF